MPFIQDIVKYNSVSVVGLEKNVGKTECLNYILKRLSETSVKVGITSIGLDGEAKDQVKQTPKPEVTIYEGMTFITTEKLFRQKQLIAEILDVSKETTALGRLVTARAVCKGKALISGAPSTSGLKSSINTLNTLGVDITLVDGALSRLSPASPAITDAMVLVTGAAFSANIPQLVSKTRFIVDLINLEEVDEQTKQLLSHHTQGISIIGKNGKLHSAGVSSSFLPEISSSELPDEGYTIAVAGAVTERLMGHLKEQKNIRELTLVAADFSRFFVSPEVFRSFLRKGGKVKVLRKCKLIAVCINPTSPEGYVLDSMLLKQEMEKAIQLPVYDVRNI